MKAFLLCFIFLMALPAPTVHERVVVEQGACQPAPDDSFAPRKVKDEEPVFI